MSAPMRIRACSRILALLLLSPALAWAQEDNVDAKVPPAEAQQSSEAGDAVDRTIDAGPLRDRVVPVSGNLFLKKGRWEVSPSGSVTARDAFFTKYLVGGTLTYHFDESWALSLRGAYAFDIVSGAAQICTTEATAAGAVRACRLPRTSELDGRAPGEWRMLDGIDMHWSPIYGKLSLWSELFVHFDLYVVGGAALVEYAGPPASGGTGSDNRYTVGGNIGLGTHVYLNQWLALRGELRDVLYVEKVTTGNSFRNQILFELGLSFFFPTSFGSGS